MSKNKFAQLAAVARAKNVEKFEDEAGLTAIGLGTAMALTGLLGYGMGKAWRAASDAMNKHAAKGAVEKRKRAEYFQNKWRPIPLKGSDKEYYLRFIAISGKDNSGRSLQEGRRRMGVAGKGTDLDNPIRAQLASSKGPKPKYLVEVRLSKIVHTSDVDDKLLKRVMGELIRKMGALHKAEKKKSRGEYNKSLPASKTVASESFEAETALDAINRETAFVVSEETMMEKLSRFGSPHPLTQQDRQEFYIVRPGGKTSIRIRLRNNSVIMHAIGKYFEVECRDAKAKNMDEALDALSTFIATLRSAGAQLTEFAKEVPDDRAALTNFISTMRRRMPTVKKLTGKKGSFNFWLGNSSLPDCEGSLNFTSRKMLLDAVQSLADS